MVTLEWNQRRPPFFPSFQKSPPPFQALSPPTRRVGNLFFSQGTFIGISSRFSERLCLKRRRRRGVDGDGTQKRRREAQTSPQHNFVLHSRPWIEAWSGGGGGGGRKEGNSISTPPPPLLSSGGVGRGDGLLLSLPHPLSRSRGASVQNSLFKKRRSFVIGFCSLQRRHPQKPM